MLPQDIHYAIDQGLQIQSSFVYANYLPEEIDLRFNRCVDNYIDKYLQPRNDLKGVDGVQRGLDSLDNLKRNQVSISLTSNIGSLPTDYRNKEAVYAQITDSCGTKLTGCRTYEQEEFAFVRKSPFAKSLNTSPIVILYQDKIELVTGNFTCNTLLMDYIKIPLALDYNSIVDWIEFPNYVIKDIIDMTIQKLLEISESQRLNTTIAVDTQQKI